MAKNGKKSKKKIYLFSGIGVLILAIIILVITQGNKSEVIKVQTEIVEKRTITQTVTATGKIDPEFKVIITPEVTGEIVSLPVKEGDQVKRGDVLLRIKADTYVAAKQRAEANLQSAKASLSMRKAEKERVTSNYNRVKELHAKKLASDAEIENAKTEYLSIIAQLESAEAMVSQNEASVKEAFEQLNKTTIIAPIAGTVTQLNVELGERVLGSGFSQGTNIMTVADLSKMVSIVDVDENDIVLITLGDTARIKVDAFGDRILKGVVSEIGNSAKTAGLGTQDQVVNFEVKIRVLDYDKNLRPGMSCNSTIETETRANVIAVPLVSITARGDFNMFAGEEEEENQVTQVKTEKNGQEKIEEIVFVVKQGKAKSVKVKTGISDDNYIQVLEGIKGGEEVISGSYRAISRELNDGSVVSVEKKRNGEKKK
ncbi:MAG: efflux RND transporter periplasmic adaptor subunit [Ignavibacteriaceae bacterium]|nr:efflux RND transporter periplasmic adaptor subunit [Ignavibacteriaceae bacterium]